MGIDTFKKTILLLVFAAVVINNRPLSFRTDSDSETTHEIEFLSEATDPMGDIRQFSGNSYKEVPPQNRKFFRVRKLGSAGAPGFWTDSLAISEYLEQSAKLQPELPMVSTKPPENDSVFIEVKKEGKEIRYLNGKQIAIQPSVDSLPRIDKTYFRVNNGDWQTLGRDGIQFTEDGEYQMDYYSVDRLGNRETAQSVLFLVDTKAPLTFLSLSTFNHPNGSLRYTNGDSMITFVVDEDGSGVEKTLYQIQCRHGKTKPFQPYTKPFSVQDGLQFCQSDFRINYHSIDQVQNQEPIKSFFFSYIPRQNRFKEKP